MILTLFTRFEKGVNLKAASMKIRRVNFQRSPVSHIDHENRFHDDQGQQDINLKQVHGEGHEDENQNTTEEGSGGIDMENLKPKTKKSKLSKIFKNFYNKWRR